jgi:peptidoglycan hydrolase-like protein with peptidoglycan-binding domain
MMLKRLQRQVRKRPYGVLLVTLLLLSLDKQYNPQDTQTMADPYNFSFDVAAFLEEQEAADTSVAPKEGVMKKPEAPVEEAPMPITEKLKKRLADTVQGFYNSTQDIRDRYNKAQETNPLLGRDAAQNEWMTALSAPAVTAAELGPTMSTLAMQDAQEQAAMRSASGITESLGRPAISSFSGITELLGRPAMPEGETDSNVVLPSTGSVLDMYPTQGLMSPSVQDTVPEVDTSVSQPEAQGSDLMTSLRPQLRNDLSSPDTTTRNKAVQNIIGTKADGSFGKGSKAKLKAWQYRHNLPTTGELDAGTLKALKNKDTYDPRKLTRSNFMQTPTFDLLKGVEGFEEKAYLGSIGENFKSGLTVGAGIDFGQHTKEALLSKGLPKSLVEKADDAGWVNLNPDNIIDPRTDAPVSAGRGTKAQRRKRGEVLLKEKMAEQKADGTFPTFTYEELAASTPVMYKPYQDAAKKDYDTVEGAGSFDALSKGTKAVLATEKYHRGEGYNISYLFEGAREDDPILAAAGIRNDGRSNNMQAWLRKVGLDK